MEQSISCEDENHHVAAPPQKSSRLMRMLHRYAALHEKEMKPASVVNKAEEGGASHFGTQEYWENRYINSSGSAKANNEWYFDYSKLRPYLSPHLLRRGESDETSVETSTYNGILILGCGESRLAEDMLQDGFSVSVANILNQILLSPPQDLSSFLLLGALVFHN
jgi:hypothetical protein